MSWERQLQVFAWKTSVHGSFPPYRSGKSPSKPMPAAGSVSSAAMMAIHVKSYPEYSGCSSLKLWDQPILVRQPHSTLPVSSCHMGLHGASRPFAQVFRTQAAENLPRPPRCMQQPAIDDMPAPAVVDPPRSPSRLLIATFARESPPSAVTPPGNASPHSHFAMPRAISQPREIILTGGTFSDAQSSRDGSPCRRCNCNRDPAPWNRLHP